MSVLDNLMVALEVNVVRLTECLVSPGWRLSFPASERAGLHYNLKGHGQVTVGTAPAIPIVPHTLVITPPSQPFRIDAVAGQGVTSTLKVAKERWQSSGSPETLQRFIAGDAPEVMMICGYFRASYVSSIDLFAGLAAPIVEQFDVADKLEPKLQSVLAELAAQEVGMAAVTTALLKQILVTLLRRSLKTTGAMLERFPMLSDLNIARAFADMATRPGASHSLLTLSQTANLSRSAFMARFARAVGCSPMAALRQLRMRHAAMLLTANVLSVEQVAQAVGYANRSSFSRAFRQEHGTDPSDYRAAACLSADQ